MGNFLMRCKMNHSNNHFLFIISLFFLILISKNLWAGTKDFYEFKWLDPDKKVYVLQDKLYENKGRFYFNLGYGSQGLSDFQDTNLLHANIGYNFAEEWGAELFYSSYSNKNNNSFEAVQNGSVKVLPFILKIKSSYGLLATYSPFYAKLNTYNLISYIDWSFALGYASMQTADNYQDFLSNNTQNRFVDVSKSAIVGKTQIRFFLSEYFIFNIDFFNYWMKARQPGNAGTEKYIRFNDWIFSLGLSF